jgi:hypothetical protein
MTDFEGTLSRLVQRADNLEQLFSSKFISGQDDTDGGKNSLNRQIKSIIDAKKKILDRYTWLKEHVLLCTIFWYHQNPRSEK